MQGSVSPMDHENPIIKANEKKDIEPSVEILPPEEDNVSQFLTARDFRENYQKMETEPKKEDTNPSPPKTAEEKYRENILAAQEKNSSKKTRNHSKIVFTALLCAFCLLVGCIGGVFSAKIALTRAKDNLSDDLSRFLADFTLSPISYSPSSASEKESSSQAATSASASQTSTQATENTAANSTPVISPLPSAVASTNAAVAKTAKEIYADSVDSVVGVTSTINISTGFFGQSFSGESNGSGMVITEDGCILTNYHVVEGGSNYRVSFYDGSTKSAELLGFDRDNDIAVLKTDATNLDLKPVKIGDSEELSVGDTVLIIGNPLGKLSYTLTSGVVSALNRVIADDSSCVNMFQTDAAVNSGNSGGPAFDMDGKLVGIVTSKYADSTIEGLSFCIPIDDVKDSIMDIIADGYPHNKPCLAVSVQTLTAAAASRYSLVKGAYIVALDESGAAAKAGVAQGDVITEIDGKTVSSVADLRVALLKKSAGDEVKLKIYRKSGETLEIMVKLDEKMQTTSARTDYSGVYDL